MKKTKFLLAGLLAFLLYSCSDDPELPPSAEPGESNAFDIPEARHYFEENADDLSFIHFRDSIAATRAASRLQSELIPDWDKAFRSINQQASLIEIPILSNTFMFSRVKQFEKGNNIRSRSCLSNVHLVIARHQNGKTDMFVVTLVPSLQLNNPLKSMENFRYLGGGDFTGKVFTSTLDGHFIEASQYVNGYFAGLLQVTTRQQLSENKINLSEDEFYESIIFTPAVKTRSGTYHFDENGETPGGTEGFCPEHPQYAAENCPFCLGEVIVRACKFCGARLEEGESCNCRCLRCGNYPCRCCSYCHMYPCTCISGCPICRPYPCTKCTKCGRHYCFGSCETTGGTTPSTPDTPSKPDPPESERCPDCHNPLPNCTCPKECPVCGQVLNNCTCPKKIECSQEAINNSSASSYNWYKFLDSGLKTDFLDKYRNAGVEHATSLENIDGNYSMREVYTNNTTDNVTLRYGEYTEAAVHNHPNSNSPSIKDVLALANMNMTSRGKFESSFIVPKTGPIYVLHVTDRDKVSYFLDLYKNKGRELETHRKELQTWLISNGGGKFPEKEFDGYALAEILQELDSGISLLQIKGESGAFKQMETTMERQNGQITNIVYTICK